MYTCFKQTIRAFRYFVIAALGTTGLTTGLITGLATGLAHISAPAAASDIDSLIIVPTPSSDNGATTDPLQQRLEFAIGEAMMDIGILPLDPDFLPIPATEKGDQTSVLAALRQVAAQYTGRLLVVEVDLLMSSASQALPVPAASAIDVASGRLVARTSTLPLLERENRLEIAAASAALARGLARQLEQNGYIMSDASRKPWGGRAIDYRISLEGFDLCERQDFLTTMEKEFPGYLSIELVKAPNPTFAVYLYKSTATRQRLQKWLEQLMVSYRIAPVTSSRVLVKDNSIRIQKDRSQKIYSQLCDG